MMDGPEQNYVADGVFSDNGITPKTETETGTGTETETDVAATTTTETDEVATTMFEMEPSVRTYTDFSDVPEKAILNDIMRLVNKRGQGPSAEITAEVPKGASNSKVRGYRDVGTRSGPSTVSVFPTKLYEILSCGYISDIIAWLPHGRSWRILEKERFEAILPKYFNHSNYSSFARQVNGWGFKRMSKGPDEDSYYNELFLRGKKDLIKFMKRGSILKAIHQEEPNLYDFRPMPRERNTETVQKRLGETAQKRKSVKGGIFIRQPPSNLTHQQHQQRVGLTPPIPSYENELSPTCAPRALPSSAFIAPALMRPQRCAAGAHLSYEATPPRAPHGAPPGAHEATLLHSHPHNYFQVHPHRVGLSCCPSEMDTMYHSACRPLSHHNVHQFQMEQTERRARELYMYELLMMAGASNGGYKPDCSCVNVDPFGRLHPPSSLPLHCGQHHPQEPWHNNAYYESLGLAKPKGYPHCHCHDPPSRFFVADHQSEVSSQPPGKRAKLSRSGVEEPDSPLSGNAPVDSSNVEAHPTHYDKRLEAPHESSNGRSSMNIDNPQPIPVHSSNIYFEG